MDGKFHRIYKFHKISPRPSFTKRGIAPPFGKGRPGGIFSMNLAGQLYPKSALRGDWMSDHLSSQGSDIGHAKTVHCKIKSSILKYWFCKTGKTSAGWISLPIYFLNRLFCYQPDIFIFVCEQLFKGTECISVADYTDEVRRIPAHKRLGMVKKRQQARESAGDILCIQSS